MPDISLTDLVDIASASGTPKITKVRNIKYRAPYSPASDFYRAFREHITELHQEGLAKNHVADILDQLEDEKKLTNYPPLVEGYKRWWGRKTIEWFEPESGVWSAHEVNVRVNPELCLEINGTAHLIKLYMKSDPLSKRRIDLITHLMDITLSPLCAVPSVMSVLDVRRSNLISPTVPIPDLTAAVNAELAYIAALWDEI